jgi:F0F1-type ATP synthase membrane subunit b/b'
MLDDTQALIAQEVQRMAGAIKEEAVLKIVETAERVVREKISENDRERLTNEYLRQVIEVPSESRGAAK